METRQITHWPVFATGLVVLVLALGCSGSPPPEPKIQDCFVGLIGSYRPAPDAEERPGASFKCNVYPKDISRHAKLTIDGKVVDELDVTPGKSTLVVDQFMFRVDAIEQIPRQMVDANEFTFTVDVDVELEGGEKRTLHAEMTKKMRMHHYKLEKYLKKKQDEAEREARETAPRLLCLSTGCEIKNTDCTFGYAFDPKKRSFQWESQGTCPEIRVAGELADTKKVYRCDDFPLHSMTLDAIDEQSSRLLDISMDGTSLTDVGARSGLRSRGPRKHQATITFPVNRCLYPPEPGKPVRYRGEPAGRGRPEGMLLVRSSARNTRLGDVQTPADIDLLGYDGTEKRSRTCSYAKDGLSTSRTYKMIDRWAKVYDRRTGRLVAQKKWRSPEVKCPSSAAVTIRDGKIVSVAAGIGKEVPIRDVVDFYEAALKR